MVYSNVNPTAFGMATSAEGINWIKNNNNPIFEKQNTSNNWGSGAIAYTRYLKLNNGHRIF